MSTQNEPTCRSPKSLTENYLLDEVRAAVLACMDFLETQLPKGIVIAGSTTFLLNGGISFKIEEKIKVEEYQDLNCREIVLAVLGHIYLWKKRDVGMGALVPDILDSFLKDSLSYVEMRNLFSDRVKLPSVEYLMDLSMKLDHSTKDMKEWVNEHKKAQTSAEIKIELPASLCDEHRRRLQN